MKTGNGEKKYITKKKEKNVQQLTRKLRRRKINTKIRRRERPSVVDSKTGQGREGEKEGAKEGDREKRTNRREEEEKEEEEEEVTRKETEEEERGGDKRRGKGRNTNTYILQHTTLHDLE